MLKVDLRKISEALSEVSRLGEVGVLPDFFIDHFVRLGSIDKFLKDVRRKVASGGGSILGVSLRTVKGGNAVNIAYAMGRLGLKVHLICLADKSTADFLRETFSELPNVSLRILRGRPGVTVALELLKNRKTINVMLSNVGDLDSFGPRMLTKDDWNTLSRCKIITLTNWAASSQYGNELAVQIFSRAKAGGVKTFWAPADITARIQEFTALLIRVSEKRLVDILSLNENEVRAISKSLGLKILSTQYTATDIKRVGNELSEKLGLTIDLHTPSGSVSCNSKEEYYSESFAVKQKVATGAGDSWDAADLLGYSAGLDGKDRLTFANASAALYVSNADSIPPSKTELIEFMSKKLR